MSLKFRVPHAGETFVATIHKDTYAAIDPTEANLHGKFVFITGASRGIGKAMAISFAYAGASGIAICSRDAEPLNGVESAILKAAADAKRPSPKVLKVALDVTDPKSVDDGALKTQATFGKLDVLVNNAGRAETWVPIAQSDPEDWWKTYLTMVRGTHLVTRAFLPLLLETVSGSKTIINVTSLAAHVQVPGSSSYSTAKFALLRFTEFLQTEYADKGIIAISVNPGNVATNLGFDLPEMLHPWLTDSAELSGDTVVWLTKERRDWLNGRYVSCTWDVLELESKKDEIIEGDKLKVRMAV